jgi:hypothetical protein
MFEAHCDDKNCSVSKDFGSWSAEDCSLDVYRAFLPFGAATALVIDACWRESEITGRSTVYMPPARLHIQYGMDVVEANKAIQNALENKFLRHRTDAGYYLVNHKLIAETTRG